MQKFNNETEFIFSNEFVGFTTIPNYIFQCKELSYRAVGIYCSILQFQNSPSHSITIKGLSSNHKEGRDAISKAIDELIKAGFLEKIQARNNGKFKGVLYKVYMKPIDTQRISPITENPITENPKPENPAHKKKIDKKENLNNKNKPTTTDSNESVVVVKLPSTKNNSNKPLKTPSEKQTKMVNAIESANKETIESKTRLNLTSYQCHTVSKWDENRLSKAIEIFNEQDGQYFALLLKIYNGNAFNNTHDTVSKPKVSKFNEMDNRDDWDFDEIERLERIYIEKKLSTNSKN